MADIAKIILPEGAEYDIKDAIGRSLIPTSTSQLTNDSGYITSVPDASTSVKGIVQLSDSVGSTSTSLAATANAVKNAYDHYPPSASTSTSGIVQLSSSTSSTSTSLAATASAVKAAYDHYPPSASTSTAGIVKLSDSVSSTSTSLAATANAVRSAYNHGGVTSVNGSTGAVTLSIPAIPNDYVIAKGTASSWTYRKWSSGVYECWYRRTIAIAIASAWGSVYYHEAAPISYPVTFTDKPYEQVTIPGGIGWAWLCGGQTLPTTTKTGQYYLIRPSSASSQNYYIDYYAKGTV